MSRHLRRIERMDTGRKNRVVPESAWPGGLFSPELHANVARFTTALAALGQGIKRASDIDHAVAQFDRWLAAHDRKIASEALRTEAFSGLYGTFAQERLLTRADRIEQGDGQ